MKKEHTVKGSSARSPLILLYSAPLMLDFPDLKSNSVSERNNCDEPEEFNMLRRPDIKKIKQTPWRGKKSVMVEMM